MNKIHTLVGAVCCLVTLLPGVLHAQDDADADLTPIPPDSIWSRGGSISLTFSNVSLTNWVGGGQSAISLGGIFAGRIKRETSASVWNNTLDVALGGARVGDNTRLFKKTDDLLIATSTYGYKFSERWSAFANAELRTQLLPGFKFGNDSLGNEIIEQRISKFMAPGFLSVRLGIQYATPVFSVGFAPISNRLTFVLDDSLSAAGAFGVTPGSRVLSELGPNLNATLDYNLFENVNFKTMVNFFAAYATLGNIDVTWETLLTLKVNQYVTTSFGTQLLYFNNVDIEQEDGTVGPAVQFRQVLTINGVYKF